VVVDFLCNPSDQRRGPLGVGLQPLARGRSAKSLIPEQVWCAAIMLKARWGTSRQHSTSIIRSPAGRFVERRENLGAGGEVYNQQQ